MNIRGQYTLGFTLKILACAALLALAGQSLQAQTAVWSGADATNNVNTNWSDASNWTGGAPGPAAKIFFFNPGANGAQGVVNNIVAGNTTTQQKYRSARVAEELAAAAPGARLVFVQTHADQDADIRNDWRQTLDPRYQT